MDKSKELLYKTGIELFSQLVSFLIDGVIVKLTWNLLLAKWFPSLSLITYANALVLIVVCGILFKQRTVRTVDSGFKLS